MELRDLDLNLLLIFNQLLIDRRVSTAAESLGLTQPATSNALKRLRKALNDELFVRTHRGMEPTPYALQLADSITLAIESLREAFKHEEQFDPLTARRTFTLAMTDIGEIYFMPKLMNALAQSAPHCLVSTVRSNTDTLAGDLQSGVVDVAVGLLPNLQAGFFQRRLFQHHYVCLCRRDHPATKQPFTLEAYSSYEHVRVIAANTGHGEADAFIQRSGAQRNVRLEVPHFVAVGHILKQSNLIATVPERFATSCAEPFGLALLAPPMPLPEITINLFWHGRYNKDPANRWIRQLMFDLFSDSVTASPS